MKNLLVIALASMLMGGCTLANWQQEAATDQQVQQTVKVEQDSDPALDQTPALSEDNQVEDLEKDINDTQILEEDFSDLE